MPKSTKQEVAAVKANLAIAPVMTEKAYGLEASRVYVFQVPRSTSKGAIAQAIATEFNVTVKSIRTLTRKGKPTRFSRGKHAYPGTTYRQDKKFAYVTVAEGDHIPVFDEIRKAAEPEAEATDQKTKKAEAKAADKAAKAEAKTTKAAKGDK